MMRNHLYWILFRNQRRIAYGNCGQLINKLLLSSGLSNLLTCLIPLLNMPQPLYSYGSAATNIISITSNKLLKFLNRISVMLQSIVITKEAAEITANMILRELKTSSTNISILINYTLIFAEEILVACILPRMRLSLSGSIKSNFCQFETLNICVILCVCKSRLGVSTLTFALSTTYTRVCNSMAR